MLENCFVSILKNEYDDSRELWDIIKTRRTAYAACGFGSGVVLMEIWLLSGRFIKFTRPEWINEGSF